MMRRSLTQLVLILSVGMNVAAAATYSVTRTDDPDPDGCTLTDCSLREAVIAANDDVQPDTISLPAGTYLIDLRGSDNSDSTGDLDVSTDLTVVGAPSTIDAQELGRIFDIRSDANVTLRQLTLQNANTSLATNGALTGGALAINGGSLTVDTVVFKDNTSQGLGAGVFATGGAQVVVENSRYSDNSSSASGGGLYSSSGVVIRDTLFERNQAEQNAGAIYLVGTMQTHRLERVVLDQNTSGGTGGAIWFTGNQSELFVSDMVASGNRITGSANGGAIAIPTTAERFVSIINSTFEGNEASGGGAITHPGGTDSMSIENSTFLNNIARDRGGALLLNGGSVDVTNVTFSGNSAVNNGGAVYVSGSGTDVSLIHTTITDGMAPNGDAIFVTGSNVATRLGNNLISGLCAENTPGTLTSEGGNVEGPGDTCNLDAGSDVDSQSAGALGILALADNGGPTMTHQLSGSSAARNNGDPTICELVFVDQRYGVRDSDCDAGSVESDAVADDLIFRYDNEE